MSRNSSESDDAGQLKMTDRRNALKTIGAASVGLLGAGSLISEASARHIGGGEGGGNPAWGQNSDIIGNSPLHAEYNLGSGLELLNSKGNESLRIAGNFCVTGPNGEVLNFEGTPFQEVRVVNESPQNLSVYTSHNPDESAMNPKPTNQDQLVDDIFDVATAAASLATTYVGSTTGGAALGITSLISGMWGFFDNGSTAGNDYIWKGTYGGVPRGGHQVDFNIHEKGGRGTIKVESKIMGLNNAWRVSFDNGLSDVNEI